MTRLSLTIVSSIVKPKTYTCDFCHSQYEHDDDLLEHRIPASNRETFLSVSRAVARENLTWIEDPDGSLRLNICLACEAKILPEHRRTD